MPNRCVRAMARRQSPDGESSIRSTKCWGKQRRGAGAHQQLCPSIEAAWKAMASGMHRAPAQTRLANALSSLFGPTAVHR